VVESGVVLVVGELAVALQQAEAARVVVQKGIDPDI
jgi:hypothetical protein